GSYRHPRTLDIVSELLASFEKFADYGEEVGGLTEEEAQGLYDRLCNALVLLAEQQNREGEDQDPVERYLSLVRSALLTGEAHLADTSGGPPPEDADRWGWVERVLPAKTQEGSPAGEYTDPADRQRRTWRHTGNRS